jgi:hypothetical protein
MKQLIFALFFISLFLTVDGKDYYLLGDLCGKIVEDSYKHPEICFVPQSETSGESSKKRYSPGALLENSSYDFSFNINGLGFVAFVYNKIKSLFVDRASKKRFVEKYTRWKQDDFEQEIVKKIVAAGVHCAADAYSKEAQLAILSEYHFYQFDGFRYFI